MNIFHETFVWIWNYFSVYLNVTNKFARWIIKVWIIKVWTTNKYELLKLIIALHEWLYLKRTIKFSDEKSPNTEWALLGDLIWLDDECISCSAYAGSTESYLFRYWWVFYFLCQLSVRTSLCIQNVGMKDSNISKIQCNSFLQETVVHKPLVKDIELLCLILIHLN